jgi:hypothetical protein
VDCVNIDKAPWSSEQKPKQNPELFALSWERERDGQVYVPGCTDPGPDIQESFLSPGDLVNGLPMVGQWWHLNLGRKLLLII